MVIRLAFQWWTNPAMWSSRWSRPFSHSFHSKTERTHTCAPLIFVPSSPFWAIESYFSCEFNKWSGEKKIYQFYCEQLKSGITNMELLVTWLLAFPSVQFWWHLSSFLQNALFLCDCKFVSDLISNSYVCLWKRSFRVGICVYCVYTFETYHFDLHLSWCCLFECFRIFIISIFWFFYSIKNLQSVILGWLLNSIDYLMIGG